MDFHVMVRAMLIGSKMPGKILLAPCGHDMRKKTLPNLNWVAFLHGLSLISKARRREPLATSRQDNSAHPDNSRPDRYSSN